MGQMEHPRLPPPSPPSLVRRRIEVQGIVQGVGFRPFVYRLAEELDLDGWVRNDAAGVTIEVEGDAARVERMVARVRADAPRRARIDRIAQSECRPTRRAPRIRDPRERRRPRGDGDRARQRGVRRLPRRAVRARRSPVPLRVHQLHELRTAVHDHARAPVRPRADQHGGIRALPRLRSRVRDRPPTAASTRSPTPVPSAGRGCGCWTAPVPRASTAIP